MSSRLSCRVGATRRRSSLNSLRRFKEHTLLTVLIIRFNDMFSSPEGFESSKTMAHVDFALIIRSGLVRGPRPPRHKDQIRSVPAKGAEARRKQQQTCHRGK